MDYLKSCVGAEFRKAAERNPLFVATEDGSMPAEWADLSSREVEKQNQLAFLEGCRKYNLALRKEIEHILLELQQEEITHLKAETGPDHVPASTFNPADYLKTSQTNSPEAHGP